MVDSDTFLTTLSVMIDDFCQSHLSSEHRGGAPAALTPSEVLTRALLGQWQRFPSERGFYRYVKHPAACGGVLYSETAFAALAGVAPISASSGRVIRYRPNRCGDRHLNCALHTIVLSRLTYHDEPRRYVARRTAEGKSDREIRRCLKRYVARRLFKLLEGTSPP